MTGYPEASIVLPVYNEEKHIRACLHSILEAEPFAERYEILVVDGGSTDRTREIVAEAALAHTLPNKVEAAYKRTKFLDQRRQMMTAWADYLNGASNVLKLVG